VLLAAGFVACSSPTSGTAAGGSEASALVTQAIAMEEFETSFASGSCAVKWRGTPALTVEQCKTALAPQSVPIVVAGITYAVWATESCSSGGACAGMQFYAVTTDGSRAWASPAFGQGYRLTRIMPRADGITLHLESATKGAAPADFELRMGEVRAADSSAAPTSPVAAVLPPSDEAPKIVQMRDGCALTWRGQTLMKENGCDKGSMSPLGYVRTVRTSNANFHIYGMSTAGGGNACDGDNFYVVAVTATDAWFSGNIGGCTELGDVTTTADGITLELVAAFGTSTCEITPSSAKCSEPVAPAKRELKVLSRRTKTIIGGLDEGPRMANFEPTITPSDGGDWTVIDDAGNCSLSENYQRTVEIRLSCETRDDDSTLCRCEHLRVIE
jgi:hypothetical protein